MEIVNSCVSVQATSEDEWMEMPVNEFNCLQATKTNLNEML